MKKHSVISIDPFEIPAHLTPPGMIYQWVARRANGLLDPNYQVMLAAGWTNVPYERLAEHFRGRYREAGAIDGSISLGGQTLMERTRDASKIARDKEMDIASVNAGSGRSVAIDLVSEFRLSAFEIETARSMSLSSSQYAAWRIRQMQAGRDRSIIGAWDGRLMFASPPQRTSSKYSWLNWLFKLISVDVDGDEL